MVHSALALPDDDRLVLLIRDPALFAESPSEDIERFRQSGYSVVTHDLVSAAALSRALRGFARRASSAECAIVYFRGAALESDGRIYLRVSQRDGAQSTVLPARHILNSTAGAKSHLLLVEYISVAGGEVGARNQASIAGLLQRSDDRQGVVFLEFSRVDGLALAMTLARWVAEPGDPVDRLPDLKSAIGRHGLARIASAGSDASPDRATGQSDRDTGS